MQTGIVITLTGTDRVGIVEEVSGVLLALGGNVSTSRMARLGGEFTMLMLVSLPAENAANLDGAFANLVSQGYKFTVTETSPVDTHASWPEYRVLVSGADHEGIVHEIASGLSASGITIESAETEIIEAPFSGAPLFSMKALVLVPPTLAEAEWIGALMDAGQSADVEVEVLLEE